MPFTIDDVEKHNKGLGQKEKERWVKVANSVLSKCEGDDCEASAIKQANAVVKQMSESAEIKGVEIFATGVWHGDKYTEKDLDALVESFTEKGFEAPIKLGHNRDQEKDGQPSFGWIDRVYREGKKLLADFTDVPMRLAEAIKLKQYRQVSSEIIWNYREGMPRVLRAVALLGADIPEVKGLEPLDKAEIVFDDDQVDVRYCQVRFEDKWQEPEIYIYKGEEDMSEDVKEYKVKVESLEDEVKELSSKVEEGESAKTELAELQAKVRADTVKNYIDGWKKEGKIIPAQEKEIAALIESASEAKVFTYSEDGKNKELTQMELVCKIFDSMPKVIELSELAKEGEDIEPKEFDNVSEEVDHYTKAYMDKHDIKDYSEARDKVFKDRPELKEAYAQS